MKPTIHASEPPSAFTLTRRAALIGIASIAAAGHHAVHAQPATYPSGLINVTVAYPPGGQADVIARGVGVGLSKVLDQSVIVENVPGAGGSIGVQRYLGTRQDGHSLLVATAIELTQTPIAFNVKYQAEDLRMVGLIASSNLLLLVRTSLPVKTPEDLVAHARSLPAGKELSFGSVGRGSGFHLVAEKFAADTGIKLVHVPYKGVAPLLTDLAGGQIDLVFMVLGGPVLGMIKSGKFKAIGFAGPQRHPEFPDVPTLDQTGLVKNFSFDLWMGLFVSRKVPEPAVQRLSTALKDVLQQPAFRADIEASGASLAPAMSLAEAERLYSADTARYRAIAKSIRLQPE